jgi:hypothetical protein
VKGTRPHALGHCICRTHVARAWHRPEHWTAREVSYLEDRYGLSTDEAIAARLGRSVLGVHLKARRLGLRKRDVGMTARQVAFFLGLPDSHVVATWATRGLLRGRRSYRVGRNRAWLFREEDVIAFLAAHGQYVDADRVPEDSPFAAAVRANGWLSLPEVHRLTGRSNVAQREIAEGRVRAARRGAHWYVCAEDLPLIRCLKLDAIEDSCWRRQSVLEARRNRRKGVAA